MSKIEREMIAEARAARQRQTGESILEVGDVFTLNGETMIVTDVYRFKDIGADVPSAPNDEQADETPWWQYAHVLGHVPPLCREDDDASRAQQTEAMILELYPSLAGHWTKWQREPMRGVWAARVGKMMFWFGDGYA